MALISDIKNIISDCEQADPENLKNIFTSGMSLPGVIAYPGSTDEVSSLLKYCNDRKIGVAPAGGRTKFFIGNPLNNTEVLLSLKKLNRVIDHETSDMISTVECGTELKSFQGEINRLGQFLPLDPPFSVNGSTAGGIISTNICGPLSTKFGTCRELLLSIRAVRADGEVIKGGAKVVKNVAGYDIPKLFVGSLGTLGVITEATFRLYPVQEYSETLILKFSELNDLADVLYGIFAADIEPSSLDIYHTGILEDQQDQGSRDDYYCITIRLDNFERAVNDQVREIKKIAGNRADIISSLKTEDNSDLWAELSDFPFKINGPLPAKVNLPLDSSFRLYCDLDEISRKLGVKISALCRPLRGVILLSVDGGRSEVESAARLLRSQVSALGGNTMIYSLYKEFEVNPWDDFGNAGLLMRQLKNNFDGSNILNPGRIF